MASSWLTYLLRHSRPPVCTSLHCSPSTIIFSRYSLPSACFCKVYFVNFPQLLRLCKTLTAQNLHLCRRHGSWHFPGPPRPLLDFLTFVCHAQQLHHLSPWPLCQRDLPYLACVQFSTPQDRSSQDSTQSFPCRSSHDLLMLTRKIHQYPSGRTVSWESFPRPGPQVVQKSINLCSDHQR